MVNFSPSMFAHASETLLSDTNTSNILVFCLFACLFANIFISHQLRSPLAKLPGPLHSKFTPVRLVLKEFSGCRRQYIHDLHNRYGSVVRVGPKELSFASPEAVKEIYTSGGSGYDKTELYDLFKQFNTRTLFSTLNKGEHSRRKRYLADRYANTNIMRPEHLGPLQDRARLFTQKCVDSPLGYADIYAQLHCFALDGASGFLLHPYGTKSLSDPKDLQLMEEMSYHDSLKLNLLNYYSPTLSFVLYCFARPRPSPLAHAYVLSMCNKPNAAPFSLLSKLQSKVSELPALAIPAECMDHLLAGIDTTGDALCFLMHELSLPKHSEIQARLHHELVSNSSVPFDQLPYLDAVVKEGLRCFPPIPMSFPRYVPAGGRNIDGTWVPEGTIVSCQPYTLHKDESVFPRALEFVPERWLESRGTKQREEAFFAFSKGGRGCLGKNLAIAEIKILLREVYLQCITTIAEQMDGDMAISDQIISSRPKGQTCKLVFKRRILDHCS